MNNNSKPLFTSGEFARLCNIRKDTLFYYDETGLLKPEITRDNGYRYYSANQLYLFDIIAMLKECGTPLKEIREYITSREPASFLALMEENDKLLSAELERLMHIHRLMRNTITLTKHALQTEYNVPFLKACPEEYFIAMPFSKEYEDHERNQSETVKALLEYLEANLLGEEYPLGSIILKENLCCNSYEEDFYCSKLSAPIQNPLLFVKPAGTYAMLNHKGSYETLCHSYSVLKDYIKKTGLQITGNSYEHELLNYLATGESDNYVIEISIQTG